MTGAPPAPDWFGIALGILCIALGLWRIARPNPTQIEADMDRLRLESTSRYGRIRIPQRAWGLVAVLTGGSILLRLLT